MWHARRSGAKQRSPKIRHALPTERHATHSRRQGSKQQAAASLTHSGLQRAGRHMNGAATVRRPVAGKPNCVQAASGAQGSTGSALGCSYSTVATTEQSGSGGMQVRRHTGQRSAAQHDTLSHRVSSPLRDGCVSNVSGGGLARAAAACAGCRGIKRLDAHVDCAAALQEW